MTRISLHDITKSYSGRDIFSGLNLDIDSGKRLALVGPNGCGKSTLLKIIAGVLEPDFGSVHVPRNTRIGYVAQELSERELRLPLEDFVLEVLPSWLQFWTQWKKALREDDKAALERLAHRQTELEHHFGYHPEYKAHAILQGLGFKPQTFAQPLRTLSGGWQERAKLARVLVAGADALFLDEPTNHLDLEAVVWLEEYLLNYSGLLVFIAHDRVFLDRIATSVLSLASEKPVFRPGNYSAFVKWQKEQEDQALKRTNRLQQDIAHKQAFVDRFGAKATKASQARSREGQIEKLKKELESLPRQQAGKKLSFSWPIPARGNRNVLQVENLDFAFPDGHRLFSGLRFELYREQKVALLGPNGQGKSTLLKILVRELEPQRGTVSIGPAMKIGYFSQHQTDILRPASSVLSEIRRLSDTATTEEELRSVLGLFLLGPVFWEKKVADLSGGEKNRLVLATLFLSRANFLILDEPTNHLDMESREALIDALNEYSGTILLVAHDRYLLEHVPHEIWELCDSGLVPHLTDFVTYWREKNMVQAPEEQKSAPKAERQIAKQQKRDQAELRNRLNREINPKKKEFERLERELEHRLEEQEQAGQQLADPATYSQPEKLAQLNQLYARAEKEAEELMTQLAFLEKDIQELEQEKNRLLNELEGF